MGVFPNFVAVNRERPNPTGLEYAPTARSYFDNQGPDVVGEVRPYGLSTLCPWPGGCNWLLGFRCYSGRKRGQCTASGAGPGTLGASASKVRSHVGSAPGTTVVEIAESLPESQHRTPAARAQVGRRYERTRRACRTLSPAIGFHAGPHGAGNNYRYQDGSSPTLLRALRQFRARLDS